ncbi:MAG TPA: L,D-transpeptidase family protein [Sphingomicrobium sp.]|nr:L,D-transpeptidase family protein [Sphingomicrobium sp.]
MTDRRTGWIRLPVRGRSVCSGVAAAVLAVAAPLSLSAPAHAAAVASDPGRTGQGLTDFYASRGGAPLWFANGQPLGASSLLLETLAQADVDGLDPRQYRLEEIERALAAAWGGNPRAAQHADFLLSQALVSYVRDLRRAGDIGVIYVDSALRPGPPSPRAILDAAARAPSLADHVASMAWMHPAYARLRSALLNRNYSSEEQRATLALNLERARELPTGQGKYVLVNAAAQRLDMVEDGKVVGTMKVVVGRPKHPTPMMAAYIRYAALNPYWNVPADLAAERIAPHVVKEGLGYLKSNGYEILSDWGDSPTIIDPSTVDWQAVADGRIEIRVRQLPGPTNAMGKMKFMFPNSEGIYLHDTPDKQLLSEASRLFSGGCIRLEDAPRLAEWLFGAPVSTAGAGTEEAAPLPAPVPVYITYLTAVPDGSGIAYFDDIYRRDVARLAQLRGSFAAGNR